MVADRAFGSWVSLGPVLGLEDILDTVKAGCGLELMLSWCIKVRSGI